VSFEIRIASITDPDSTHRLRGTLLGTALLALVLAFLQPCLARAGVDRSWRPVRAGGQRTSGGSQRQVLGRAGVALGAGALERVAVGRARACCSLSPDRARIKLCAAVVPPARGDDVETPRSALVSAAGDRPALSPAVVPRADGLPIRGRIAAGAASNRGPPVLL